MSSRFDLTTKSFVETELNKLCLGYDTLQFFGEYSKRSTWQPEDVVSTALQACLQRTSVEDVCESGNNPPPLILFKDAFVTLL